MKKIREFGGRIFGNRRWVDFVLIFVMILSSIFVRIGSLTKDYNRFSFTCFPDLTEECVEQFYDEEGNPYFFEMDSYYYLEQAKIIIEGRTEEYDRGQISVLSVFLAIIYRIVNTFSSVSLLSIAVIIGPIVFSLSSIPVYLFVKKRTNRVGGFSAGLFAGICAPFVAYASFARFDTDIFLFLLPSLVMIFYILALEMKEAKKVVAYTIVSILSFLTLAFTWGSHAVYFYLVFFITLTMFFVFLIRERFRFSKVIKMDIFKKSGVFIVFFFAICLLANPSSVLSKPLQILGWITGGNYHTSFSGENVYPDGQKFVAELQPAGPLGGGWLGLFDPSQIGLINWFGGITMVLFIAIVCCYFVFRVVKYMVFRETKESNIMLYIILLVWFFVTTLAGEKGVRFLKEPMIPTAIMLGVGMGILYRYFKEKKKKMLLFSSIWLLVVIPSFRAYASFDKEVSHVDDMVAEASLYIKENFDENYVITSWWDLGYFYAFLSNHRVSSDGGSFAEGRFWIADALMSEDEKYASGIFKMVANFQDPDKKDFLKTIEEASGGQEESIRVIRRIAGLEKEEAIKVLVKEFNMSEENALKITSMLFGKMKAIVVIPKSTLGKEEVLSYYHCWNFKEQESICPEGEGTEEKEDGTVEDREEEGNGEVGVLKLESSYNKKTVMARMYDRDDKSLKHFKFIKEFESRLNKVVVFVAE